jgi:hypothetical protein
MRPGLPLFYRLIPSSLENELRIRFDSVALAGSFRTRVTGATTLGDRELDVWGPVVGEGSDALLVDRSYGLLPRTGVHLCLEDSTEAIVNWCYTGPFSVNEKDFPLTVPVPGRWDTMREAAVRYLRGNGALTGVTDDEIRASLNALGYQWGTFTLSKE